MYVCPTVTELCFYGGWYPCFRDFSSEPTTKDTYFGCPFRENKKLFKLNFLHFCF